jgi:type IV secretion system protein VirB6
MLCACSDFACIDADDFGTPKVIVPANFKDSSINGLYTSQWVKWKNSGLVANGEPIYAVVHNWSLDDIGTASTNTKLQVSAWCPWYSDNSYDGALSKLCSRLKECEFAPSGMCSDTDEYAPIINAPCLVTKGAGLYMLIPYSSSFDPNASITNNLYPDTNAAVVHLGEPSTGDYSIYAISSDGSYKQAGGAKFTFPSEKKALAAGNSLYFKILDTYYADNSGQYIVSIKSGVNTNQSFNATTFDPELSIITPIKEYLFGTESNNHIGLAATTFKQVLGYSQFQYTVQALFALMIAFNAAGFLIGISNISVGEFLTKMLKIAIVQQLLTVNGWAFFYDYLLFIFIDGTYEIVNIIKSSINVKHVSIWTFLSSPETIIKITAIDYSSAESFFLGLAYVAGLMIILGVLIYAMIRIITLCITSLVMTAILVAIGPIFICSILFEFTKRLFDNWIKQLISYSIQVIVITGGVYTFTDIIVHQLYVITGHRVCKYYIGQMYVWQPKYTKNEEKVDILLPEAFYKEDGTYCKAYECTGERYPSFPYLDPDNENDMKIHQKFITGNFVSISNIVSIFISALLLNTFLSQAAAIGRFISENAMGMSRSMADNVSDGLYGHATKAISIAGGFAASATGVRAVSDRMRRSSLGKAFDFDHKAKLSGVELLGDGIFRAWSGAAKGGINFTRGLAGLNRKTGKLGFAAASGKVINTILQTPFRVMYNGITADPSESIEKKNARWGFTKEIYRVKSRIEITNPFKDWKAKVDADNASLKGIIDTTSNIAKSSYNIAMSGYDIAKSGYKKLLKKR